jgi:ABC-type glycerol-3-phosphate transport system substrate-binding protein/DNA-binding transcriptional regulator YhcF (GntR family)
MELLNHDLSIPLHYQVMVILKERIENGIYPVGSKIPNEMELCSEFAVSRPTIRRAVEELVDMNLLEKKHPQGTFVRKPDIQNNITVQPNMSFSRESPEELTVSLASPLMDFYLFQAVDEFEHKRGCKIFVMPQGPWQESLYHVVNALIENQVPDVFLVSNVAIASFAKMGVILPFDSLLEKKQLEDLKNRERNSEYCQYIYNDMLYGYPFFSETRLMYYRRDHFDELHLPYPDSDWTHDDFLELGKRLTLPRKARWAYAYPTSSDGDTLNTIMPLIMQNGGEICGKVNGKVQIMTNQSAFAESFRWLCDLVLQHRIAPPIEAGGDYSKLCTMFLEGSLSMIIGLPSFSIILRDRLADSWGVVKLPKGRVHGKSFRGRIPFCISAKCKNPRLAMSFIQHLTDRNILFPYTRRVGVFPPVELYEKDVIIQNTQPELRIFVDAMFDSTGWDKYLNGQSMEMDSWQMPIQHTLRRVLQKKISYETALEYIYLALRDTLKRTAN